MDINRYAETGTRILRVVLVKQTCKRDYEKEKRIVGRHSDALCLVRRAQDARLFPTFARQNSRTWDLHSFSLAVASMLLADSLLTVAKQEVPKISSKFESIVVVTGKGLGSGPEGPVLREGVPQFLRETFGPEIVFDERNEGIFLLSQESLRAWVDLGNFDKFKQRMTGD